MAVMKVDSARFELVKDAKEYNAFVWTGLTLGNLLSLHHALRSCSNTAVDADCYTLLNRAIEEAEKGA